MSDERYFDLPAGGDEYQEEIDRERKRRTVSSQWSFRSQADRNRSKRPKVRVVVDPSTLKPFVNSNGKESQILLPSSPPSEVVRDLPAVPPSVTKTGSTEVPEDPNEFYNPEHYAGLHRGAPDLENCLACQYKAKKTAINAAISKRNNLIQRYHSLNSSTRSRVDELMQSKKDCATCKTKGHDLEAALEHVRVHASDYGLEPWEEKSTPDKKRSSPPIVGTSRNTRETNFDKALKFLGKEDMDPTEKAILRQVHAGKSYDDIVLAFKPEAKEQVIEGMRGKPVESPKVPEIAPASRTKIDMNGNVVPWEQKDWIRHHTAELRKAKALGDTKGIKLHQKQLAIHEGAPPEVVKPNPNGKVWKTGIVSKEEAWASALKADETGKPQCALGCNLETLHKQCPEHGQLLFND